jgi:hypothetical protein
MDHFNGIVTNTVDVIFKKFGEKKLVTYIPQGDKPYRIRGVFSEQYWETDLDGMSLNTRQKNIFVHRNDLKNDPVASRDMVLVRGQTYVIKKYETDDAGNMILHLGSTESKDYLSEFDTSLKEDYL